MFVCLCVQVQLSEMRRELQELKASLRVAQKEKEQLQAEKKANRGPCLTPSLINTCSWWESLDCGRKKTQKHHYFGAVFFYYFISVVKR